MVRAKSGVVGLEKHGNNYRLRLPRAIAEGSSRYISTGLRIDSPDGYKQAQRLVWDIEDQIHKGTFKVTDHKNQNKIPDKITIKDLWQRYTEYKQSEIAVTTLNKTYGGWSNIISLLPYEYPEDAGAIKIWLLNNKSNIRARQFIIHMSAALDWAVSRGLLAENKFKGLSSDIKVTKGYQIDPFTTSEMLAILETFQGSHYEHFVKFLFLTGCRTGEAIALQWKQVADDYSYVIINATYYLEKRARVPTKTKTTRKIPCNSQMARLLQGLSRGNPTDYVFTSLQGCVINNHNFLLYHWRPNITRLVEQGLVERYRPAYNTRHTAITRMLESGLTMAEVARVVGNSPRVINEHYAGVSRSTVLPEI
ncbi:MAG: tyrosine recombinase XerC [Nostoc sp. EkiNYC01]|nr:tyrosine-type recombinase/integrase [Nostoc sp. EkiNYC01]